jgi:hypothetical protein
MDDAIQEAWEKGEAVFMPLILTIAIQVSLNIPPNISIIPPWLRLGSTS